MNPEAKFLGDLTPLTMDEHSRRPDRREVSKRWLTSSVLVGITSSLLMGGALFAALEGREQLTLPAQAYERPAEDDSDIRMALKGNHPGLFAKVEQEDSNIIMASIITREGDKNIVKARPFMKISTAMAIPRGTDDSYPSFNPLSVFSGDDATPEIAKTSDTLYGADVDSEVSLNVIPFPFDEAEEGLKRRQQSADILQQVQQAALGIEAGGDFVSAIAYFDNDRFSGENQLLLSSENVTITAENVSVLEKVRNRDYKGTYYEERNIDVRAEAGIAEIFRTEGLSQREAQVIENILVSDLGTNELRAGDTLHSWFENSENSFGERIRTVEKVSVFRGPTHLVSIARNDEDQFVYAVQPESPEDLSEFAEEVPVISSKNFPSVYDGIYRSAMSQGLTADMAGSLVKIFAFDLDFKSRVSRTDNLEVFLSLEPGQQAPTEESEILYASVQTGKVKRRYYRFQDEKTGYVDYYDETGKSAKKFLLRQPVPNGRFRSAFGMRRHPISRRMKMHGGVDWAAPHGTPIIAAGNGTVQKAGWAGGAGKRTIIRHANGYETHYFHQTRYGKGITPGARVRQGQIIGYVGSTGYSTGPHLHYEVHVNGRQVDPMRIKLPKGRVLKDTELARFEAERDRIDALVNQDEEQIAALN